MPCLKPSVSICKTTLFSDELQQNLGIALSDQGAELVNRHFVAACHHRLFRQKAQQSELPFFEVLHLGAVQEHLENIRAIVCQDADFSGAIEQNLLGDPEGWLEADLYKAFEYLMNLVPCSPELDFGEALPDDFLLDNAIQQAS